MPTAAQPAPAEAAGLYVYYKVPVDQLARVAAAARALQAGLRGGAPGLACALLRRPELRDGQVTVMETYTGVLPPGFEARLAAAAAACPVLPAARMVERFTPLG